MIKRIIWVSLFVILMIGVDAVAAQQELRVQCGDVIQGEFTQEQQSVTYLIDLSATNRLSIETSRIGDYLKTYLAVYTPQGIKVAEDAYNAGPTIQTSGLPVTGTYSIVFQSYYGINGVGGYSVYFTCADANGNVIDNRTPNPVPTQSLHTTNVTIGYPGVGAIDFSDVSPVSLIFDVPMTSNIAVQGAGVSGFSFDASEGDVLAISATRFNGNLGVGFVVFAQPNIPVFIAGPISGKTFSIEITLPQTGSYVIGLFRMGDVPVSAEATAFQIKATLNP